MNSTEWQLFVAANNMMQLAGAFHWWLDFNGYVVPRMRAADLDKALAEFRHEIRIRYAKGAEEKEHAT